MSERLPSPPISNKEVLNSVVEDGEIPSSQTVIDSFGRKRESLVTKLADLEAVQGVTLDAMDARQRQLDIANTKAEIDQIDSLWAELGGHDIEAASDLKGELDFKADADDYVVANANIREAKDAFYENFVKEYSKDEAEQSEEAPIENADKPGDLSVDAPEGKFDLDAEIAAARERIQKKADALVPDVVDSLERKYPKIEPIDLGESNDTEVADRIEPIPLSREDLDILANQKIVRGARGDVAEVPGDRIEPIPLGEDEPSLEDEVEEGSRNDAEKRIDAFLDENVELTKDMSDAEKESLRKTMTVLLAAGLLNEEKIPKLEGGEDTEGAEGAPEVELSPEEKAVEERLVAARGEYARLTAEDRRSYLGRFLQGEGWLSNKLRAIPAVAGMMDSINDRFGGEEVKRVTAEFEAASKADMEMAVKRLIEARGLSPESQELKEMMIALQIDADSALEDKIVEERHKQSKKAGKFTNWWVQHEGWKWNIVKGAGILTAGVVVGASAGAIAAVAGVAGVTVGVFGVAFGTGASVAGGLAGGATGLGIARGVTSRRANASTKEGGPTIAEQQSATDKLKKKTAIEQAEGNADAAMERIIRATEQSTSNEMLRNRKRLKTATGLGVSAGALAGGLTGGMLHNYLNRPRVGRSIDKLPDNTVPESQLDNTFNVEGGNGLIREWDQWASANGHPIDSETSAQLHQAVLERFGPDGMIDLKGVGKAAETYTQNGDVRIGASGSAHWRKGVAEFAQQWLEAKGKW